METKPQGFDPDCSRCPRLARFLLQVKARHPDYHCRPVAPFGDPEARLLIVGLAPGMHGANASGRPFTGDYAGILLYQALYDHGYSNGSKSVSRDDGLRLKGCRITNAVKCLPPENKPTTAEIKACNPYLAAELAALAGGSVVLALGGIAHNAVLRALGLTLSRYPFGHRALHRLGPGLRLLDSYHCSRYNTQTKRLTHSQFYTVFEQARALL
jgi:uracil-DNA glycosylase family 4